MKFRIDRDTSFVILLAGIFIISFAIPLAFAAKVSGIFMSDESVVEIDQQFPSSVAIFSLEKHVRIEDFASLNPATGEDFLISSWVQFKRLPKRGERMIFLSKYDSNSKSKSGFALALTRDRDSFHPEAYWQDESGRGVWRTFKEISIVPGEWVMLALSYYSGKYLGLHAARLNDDAEVSITLLGGYGLEEREVPASKSALTLGAVGNRNFRGRIGPMGILKVEDLEDELSEAIEAVASSGESIPDEVDLERVVLWFDGKKDRSNNSLPVHVSGRRRSGKMKNKS